MGEQRQSNSWAPFWTELLKAACVQCLHQLLTGPAPWELWTTAIAFFDRAFASDWHKVLSERFNMLSSVMLLPVTSQITLRITSKLTTLSPPKSLPSLHWRCFFFQTAITFGYYFWGFFGSGWFFLDYCVIFCDICDKKQQISQKLKTHGLFAP